MAYVDCGSIRNILIQTALHSEVSPILMKNIGEQVIILKQKIIQNKEDTT